MTLGKYGIFGFLAVGALTLRAADGSFSGSTIHIGVVVSNLERSMEFYREILGMVRADDPSFDIDRDFAARSGLSGGVPFHVEVLKLREGPESTQWKLMSFENLPEPDRGTFIQDAVGMRYVTLFYNDLSPVIRRLNRASVPFLGRTPTPLADNRYFVLIQDPDGIFLELIGPWEEAP